MEVRNANNTRISFDSSNDYPMAAYTTLECGRDCWSPWVEHILWGLLRFILKQWHKRYTWNYFSQQDRRHVTEKQWSGIMTDNVATLETNREKERPVVVTKRNYQDEYIISFSEKIYTFGHMLDELKCVTELNYSGDQVTELHAFN